MRNLFSNAWKLIVRTKWYLLVGIMCLVVGLGIAGFISYQVMPIRTSHIQNVVLDINGDGLEDFIVSAEVVISNQNPLVSNQ